MAEIRVYIQPRLPAASSQTAFYDFSKHVEFDTMEWEQNDQGNASTLRASIYSILPVSTTHWNSYAGASEAARIQAALDDPFYRLKIPARTEIQVRDVSTNPHTIIWGGVITRVSENRDGGAILGSLEAVDYTALLNESVALEFTPPANSTIKQTITSQTYSFTPTFAQRTAGLSMVTVSSIAIGAPYSRNLDVGDTIVVDLSDNTYDGVHKVTGVTVDGSTYKVRFQQYSNVADSPSTAVTGTITIPGFMTTANAPQLDSRISVSSGNIADLNPDYRWSPQTPNISRNVSNVARTGTTATITTSAAHGFGVDRVVTIALTNGPTGYADLNGSFVIASTPTDSTFTYTTLTTGTITSGAATGTAVCAGEITPTPMKGGTLAKNLQYAVEKGNGCFYLGAGSLDGGGNLTIPLNVKSLALSDLITNGLFDSNRTVSISTIKSTASTTKTVTTAFPHGLYTGYTVTISGASGANAADVNGNTYTITVTSSTVFTITAATSNALNLTGGSIAISATSAWALGSFSVDTTGANGPYGVGNNVYYTGSDHQDMELASTNRISVTAGEQYFFSWRQKSGKTNKSHLHVKFYNAGGTAVGNSHGYDICKTDLPNDEWGRNYGIAIVPATAVTMTPVLHHDNFSSSYSVYYTDIQAIKLTGAFGFSDRPREDNTWYNSINGTGVDLRDFENPTAPEESGEAANRVYVYAPYTTVDPLTGAKQLTQYRNTYDFVQGVWSNGGKRIEGSLVGLDATDQTTANLTAQKYFKERGLALRSYEFEHTSGKLNVGDVVPFIWNELGIAEALIVRRQVGYLIGQDVYYRVQLGGDLSFQRSTMYLVERSLREIKGDAAYFSPPPSPYPGYPTEGGVVTPAIPTGDIGAKKVDLSWEYPQSIIKNSSFGGFVVLRSADAGTNWIKVSTQEPILTSENPLAPDTSVPSYSDTNVQAATNYIYKVAAIDVSGPTPILTGYSTNSATLTPTDVTVDFGDAYNGLGINVPKITTSVTYPGNGVAATISTITSGASTTATVTTSAAHGFSSGYVVGITGAVGTNSADVNGKFFIITVTNTTQFTITKSGTNSLSLTGGTATGWDVSGNFVDDNGTSRVLGDTWSLVQFPVGQIAYSEADGKLYRNGKPGTTAFDNKWTRAAVDAIDVTSDGSIVISADKITTGVLNAARIQAGTLSLAPLSSNAITSTNFTVTNTGAVTATSVDLTGKITATSGAIGGWSIAADRITNLASTKYAGIIDTAADTGLAFFAGATDTAGSSATFSVTNAGAVTAQSIILQGASSTIGSTGNAGQIVMKAQSGQVGAVIEAQTSAGSTTGSVLGLRAGGTGTTGTLGSTIGAVIVYDGTGDQGTFITGGLMISNDYSKAGSANYPLPKDGVIVFTDNVTSAYAGGGDLYQTSVTPNALNTIRTSGNFLADGVVTATLGVSTTLISSSGDISVQPDGGDLIIRHGTGAGVNPRILFRQGGGTYVAGLRATVGTLTLYADSGTTTLGNFTAGAINGSSITASGNVISNGTGFLNDTPTTQATPTTYTSGRAAIWTNTAGTAYRLDRYVAASSARAKKNINSTDVAPEQFYGINLVDFEYDIEAGKSIWPTLSEMPSGTQHGVIYEQVKEVMPEAVFDENTSGAGDPPGINWDQIYFAALVALQDMNDRVKSLEQRIADLEA